MKNQIDIDLDQLFLISVWEVQSVIAKHVECM